MPDYLVLRQDQYQRYPRSTMLHRKDEIAILILAAIRLPGATAELFLHTN